MVQAVTEYQYSRAHCGGVVEYHRSEQVEGRENRSKKRNQYQSHDDQRCDPELDEVAASKC